MHILSATGAGPFTFLTSFLLMYNPSKELSKHNPIASLLSFNGFCSTTCLLIGLLLPMSNRSILPIKLLLLPNFYLFLECLKLRIWGLKYVTHGSRTVVIYITFLCNNKWLLFIEDYVSPCKDVTLLIGIEIPSRIPFAIFS